MMLMERNIYKYFYNNLQKKYPELDTIDFINPEIGKVKITSKNNKTWTGRIFLFSDKDYKELVGKKRSIVTAGVNIDKIF